MVHADEPLGSTKQLPLHIPQKPSIWLLFENPYACEYQIQSSCLKPLSLHYFISSEGYSCSGRVFVVNVLDYYSVCVYFLVLQQFQAPRPFDWTFAAGLAAEGELPVALASKEAEKSMMGAAVDRSAVGPFHCWPTGIHIVAKQLDGV